MFLFTAPRSNLALLKVIIDSFIAAPVSRSTSEKTQSALWCVLKIMVFFVLSTRACVSADECWDGWYLSQPNQKCSRYIFFECYVCFTADFRHVGHENVFIGVGSDEAIDLLMRIVCVPGEHRFVIFIVHSRCT